MTEFVPNEVAERRAIKDGDSSKWTPRDALLSILRDIDAGKINPTRLMIHHYEDQQDGSIEHGYCVANLTYSTHIALLEVAKMRIVQEWMVRR